MKKDLVLYDQQTLTKLVTSLSEHVEWNIRGWLQTNEFRDVIFVCTLRGAFMFFSDLVKKIDRDIKIDFIQVSTYENNQKVKEPIVVHNSKYNYKDSHVYIVEDIVDSGNTIHEIATHFTQLKPYSINLITLFSKKPKELCKSLGYDEVIVGHYLEEEDFVYGYGLDNCEMGRNLTEIRLTI